MNAPALAVVPDALPAPVDAFFERWAAGGFVWLPEFGMGRLRVHEAPYDAAYFEKYQGYAATPMGRGITEGRAHLLRRFVAPFELTVDVGIGCGDFVDELLGLGYQVGGYDVNPAGEAWLRARALWADPYEGTPDALTLWDVLEHIPDPAKLLHRLRIGGHVFVSVPVVPADGPPPLDWKHLRRDEHCWYWTREGFVRWMGAHGFQLLADEDFESRLGREDIGTFAFRRVA